MFKGSLTALVTPFLPEGGLDERAYRTHIAWQIAGGTHGLVPAGTTGESPTLSHEEHKRVIEIAVEEARGNIPVIAGAGSNSTREAVEFTRHAKSVGADALLVVTPYYNKPTQEGLYLHYREIARAADGLPVVVYNIPGRSVIDLSVETLLRLRNDCSNIVAVKDATGDLVRPLKARAVLGPDFIQLSGNDDTAIAFNAQGGVGCISVMSNVVPDLCATMQNAWADGDLKTCFALRDRLAQLSEVLFCEANPGPVKYALERMGRMSGQTRLPLAPLSEPSRAKVDGALRALGLI
ncbi:4-hydroxy-tetrahydrodipicolinate synthase [Phaeovibrio sulfidiphilus]|uniref:4-hydroxy-tetrahydrodipicolinate synthase n=1 Tax=Phaeovibrio sulfidiphilus TaxID=1220600 RepID=A0A8J6YH16_9PROT|nr:4-hydroxy-tetrahydrodipicolinate synthase [Phaeovibrio sulfidiphilus]MBE1236141.1 4-hydroxy-tetrahydrodipicolinate synthase [Phaeovibrio sulfidiphilus]